MRLALVISTLWGGGAQRVMSVLANHWAARGDAVTLVTYERSAIDYPLDARVEHISLDVNAESRGFFAAIANNWRRLAALRRTLRAIDPSAIVSFEERMNASVLLATIGLGVRRVVSERTDPRHHHVDFFWAMLRRLTYPLAEALVVQTEAVRPWARRAILDRSRVHVVPNPVRAMESFARGASVGANPVANPVVVAVGRLVTPKGFDVLLRAFASIAGEYPEWRVTIVGDGPERERLTLLASQLGIGSRLTITGWLDEPGEVLAAAEVYVLSSRYEGFPNALLEAMACGVPVVATTCAGAAEIVTDGVDGVLVPVDGQEEIARALSRLMASGQLRQDLGARARASATRFRTERIIEKWDEIIAPMGAGSKAGLLQNPGK